MRRLLAVSAALLLSGFGATALALSAPSAPTAADFCSGPGFRQIGTADAPLCVHRAPDLPPTDAVTAALPPKPPTCYGDGESGARVQLIYGWLQGRPDRSATTVPLIRKEVAGRMDGLIRSNSPGHDLGIRFAFEAGCRQLSVLRIAFPSAPNSDGAGHCLDGPATMCPNGGTTICRRAPVEQLDCRRDDYWDPDAKEGSYLAEHRNIARSRFFGPSPLDDLPLPARPARP